MEAKCENCQFSGYGYYDMEIDPWSGVRHGRFGLVCKNAIVSGDKPKGVGEKFSCGHFVPLPEPAEVEGVVEKGGEG